MVPISCIYVDACVVLRNLRVLSGFVWSGNCQLREIARHQSRCNATGSDVVGVNYVCTQKIFLWRIVSCSLSLDLPGRWQADFRTWGLWLWSVSGAFEHKDEVFCLEKRPVFGSRQDPLSRFKLSEHELVVRFYSNQCFRVYKWQLGTCGLSLGILKGNPIRR